MFDNFGQTVVYLVIAFVAYQVLTSCGMFPKIDIGLNMEEGYRQHGGSEEAKNALLEKVQQKSNLDNGVQYDLESGVKPHEQSKSQLSDYNNNVLPYPQISTNPTDSYFSSGGVCQPSDPGCFSGSALQAPDLLPHDHSDNAWNETSPQVQGHITDQNFLESGHHHGINTVGQSLKNANRQVRSDPPIPKVNIGPWSNSTTDPDTNRKGFEIES